VPVNDTLAVRASAFSRRGPGYIDNIQTGQNGINREDASGGRLSALWRPSDAFSLKLGALLQDSHRYGSPTVDVGLGFEDLQQSTLRESGRSDRKYQIYSAVAAAKLGPVDLTSITGYSINELYVTFDFTPLYGPYTQYGDAGFGPFTGFGVPGTLFTDNNRTEKFSQEIRLTTWIGQSIEFLWGAFYTHEGTTDLQSVFAADNTPSIVGTVATFNFPTKFEEYAAFTDLTFHVTDRFELQVGGRESHNSQVYNETDAGPLAVTIEGGSPTIYPRVNTSANAFTFLVTPQLKLTSDVMVYARVASGYRAGGPNSAYAALQVPDHFDPDKTLNYEIGIKGEALEHRVVFDGSLYYIDWKSIQLGLATPAGYGYQANAGHAKSEGVELSVQLRPINGLTLGAWASWNEAVLTEALPPASTVFGAAGDRLPYTPRFSGSLTAEDVFVLYGELAGFVGGSVSYVGDREGWFTAQPPRPYLPSYARTDLHAGVRYKDWSFQLFGNNVTDKRGVLNNDQPIYGISLIQPRTIGLSLSRTF
jgi:iron complex outermembrane recepter protein